MKKKKLYLEWFFIKNRLICFSQNRPFVEGETAAYLRRYFLAENIPVFEDQFCNHQEVTPEIFNGDLDLLIERTELHKGHLLSLWPWGYKVPN